MNLHEKKVRETRLIELVETHNLAMSLKRISDAPSFDSNRWKRALYHALAMSYVTDRSTQEKIRVAMELP